MNIPALVITAVLVLAQPALAQPAQKVCEGVGAAAETAMKARQAGVPMSAVMSHAGTTEILQKIVIDAYSVTRYGTDEYQERAVQEFRNKWELACFSLVIR
jgi:hypothetical protein